MSRLSIESAVAAAALSLVLAGGARAEVFNINTPSAVQTYSVTTTGTYFIEAAGAQGGTTAANGGKGVVISGDVELFAGETLDIAVGAEGGTGNAYGGGGGGTFVWVVGQSTPLLVAGGGGGAGFHLAGVDGQTGTSGAGGTGSSPGAGGQNGAGGVGGGSSVGSTPGGGGGGGWAGDGTDGFGSGSGGGGKGYSALATAFDGGAAGGGGGVGGYGGGGGGGAGGGGGGGYSGGGGGGSLGGAGGGGGSFYAASFTDIVSSATRTGNGFAEIDFVAASVPEPSTWAMLALGFAGLGLAGARRARRGAASAG